MGSIMNTANQWGILLINYFLEVPIGSWFYGYLAWESGQEKPSQVSDVPRDRSVSSSRSPVFEENATTSRGGGVLASVLHDWLILYLLLYLLFQEEHLHCFSWALVCFLFLPHQSFKHILISSHDKLHIVWLFSKIRTMMRIPYFMKSKIALTLKD